MIFQRPHRLKCQGSNVFPLETLIELKWQKWSSKGTIQPVIVLFFSSCLVSHLVLVILNFHVVQFDRKSLVGDV